MRRRARALGLVVLVLGACGGAEPRFEQDDLPRLVLREADAPAGTSLDASSSGSQSLVEFAEGDERKRRRFQDAGFATSYFTVFLAPGLFETGEKESVPRGQSLATSFAILFSSAGGAGEGLRLVEESVRQDGANLRGIPADGLGRESFGLAGTLQRGFPPGYLFAWRIGNVVFGLIAAGAEGGIKENAARALAEQMEAKAR